MYGNSVPGEHTTRPELELKCPPFLTPSWPPSLSQDSVSAFMWFAGLSVRCRLRLSRCFRRLQIHGACLAALILLQVVRQALVLN